MVYLDCNSTTPVLEEVADLVYMLMTDEFGNAGSRTHEYGLRAKQAVELARERVAAVVNAEKSEVIFTSGATESNNIAILGLQQYANQNNKKHIITTSIEHKAVLEPIHYLSARGFDVTYLNVGEDGLINIDELKTSLRQDTFLVSIMHVNNETGCIQPLPQICEILEDHDAYLHVDAAQSFGKYPLGVDNHRIDLISASGHKLYAPKGIGALVMRRRGSLRPPLTPIIFGGGQEKALRPGTLAVPLIAGFGLACDIAKKNASGWCHLANTMKLELKNALRDLDVEFNGTNTSPYVLNFSVQGVNSEAAMLSLKGIASLSNGSACTSSSYTQSHVLKAMGLSESRISCAIRVSWCHMTGHVDWDQIVDRLKILV